MKKIISLVLTALILLTSCSALFTACALDESELTFSATTIELRQNLSADLKETAVKANDGRLGIPVVISTFWRYNTQPQSKQLIIAYFAGTNTERIGTDSDTDIVNDMLEEGFCVVVIDYLDNPLACGTDLSFSAQNIWGNEISAGKNYLAGYTPNQYAEGYPVPAGCRVAHGITYFDLAKHAPNGTKEFITMVWNRYYATSDLYNNTTTNGKRHLDANGQPLKWADDFSGVVKKDGTPIKTELQLSIVYPANPKEGTVVPMHMLASSSDFIGNLTSGHRPFFLNALFNGYAATVYEHEYVPMSLSNHYGHWDTMFSLDNWVATSVHTAAVRCVRYLEEDYGYNADYCMPWGFSKSGYGAGILSDVNAFEKGNPKTYAEIDENKFPKENFPDYWEYINSGVDLTDSPEEQPWLVDRHGNPISSAVTCVYSGAGAACTRNMDWCFVETSVPFASSIGRLDDTGGFNTFIGQTTRNFDNALNNESIFIVPEELGHNPAYGWNPDMELDMFDPIWEFLDNHIRNAISPTAPEVVWTTPANSVLYDDTNQTFEIKFSRRMDVESVQNGVKLIRLADNKELPLDFTVLHGQTTFRFTSDGIINASKYRLEITSECKAADGVALAKTQTETFTFSGDELLNVSADSYVSSANPDANYGSAEILKVNGTADKTYLSFNSESGFAGVDKAVLVLNQTEKKNSSIEIYGVGDFSENTITYNNAPAISGEAVAVAGLGESGTSVDVTDYIKSLNGNTANFGIISYGKTGVTLHYDFEGYTETDFVSKTHYKWGGETGAANYATIVSGGNNGSNNAVHITGFTGSGERMKLLDSFGSELSTLTAEHLGLKFHAQMFVKPESDCRMQLSMYGKDGYEGWDAEYYDIKAGQWNEINYYVTVTQRMIDANVNAITLQPGGVDFYLDDVTVKYDVNPGAITSKEGAAKDNSLQNAVLVLYKPETKEINGSAAMVQSGSKKYDTVTGNTVNGKADTDITKVKKGYMKLPITEFNSGTAMLNFSAEVEGNIQIGIYGILADDSNFANTYGGNITWNNAYANIIDSNAVDAELITTVTANNGTNQVDVSAYVAKMKAAGYDNVTFVFTAETADVTLVQDFENMTEYNAVKPSTALSGFPYGITQNPLDKNDSVFYFEKSGLGSGATNGYNQAMSFTGFLKDNGVWETSDIGSTYIVTFDQYVEIDPSLGDSCSIYGYINPAGSTGHTSNVPGITYKTYRGGNAQSWNQLHNGEWITVEYTINVTSELVSKYANYTAIVVSSGWYANYICVDDITVTKKAGTASIVMGEAAATESDVVTYKTEGFDTLPENIYTAGEGASIANDPTDSNNKVLKILPRDDGNMYMAATNIGDLFKKNNVWEASDIGNTYTVTYKKYAHRPGETATGNYDRIGGKYSGITDGYTSGVAKTYKKDGAAISDPGANYWYEVKMTFTVTEDMVNTASNKTYLLIGSGQSAVEVYIDDITVNCSVAASNTNETAPYLQYGNGTKQYATVYNEIDGAKPGDVIANDGRIELTKAPVSDPEGLSKMYYTFDKKGINHPTNAVLKLTVQNPTAGRILNIYGLNAAVEGDITWNSAYANQLNGNGMNLTAVYGGAPIASLTLTNETEYSIDVTDFVVAMQKEFDVTLVVAAADEKGETVVSSAKLSLDYALDDDTAYSVSVGGVNNNASLDASDVKNGLMFSAIAVYPVEESELGIHFVIDGKVVNYAVERQGDSYYYVLKDVAPGSHTVKSVMTYKGGSVESTPLTFTVGGATLGDVNADGVIDTVDLSELKLYLANVPGGGTFVKDAADFNGDTIIDTVDLSALKLKLAGV